MEFGNGKRSDGRCHQSNPRKRGAISGGRHSRINRIDQGIKRDAYSREKGSALKAKYMKIKGVLIDLDGVMYNNEDIIPGAVETIKWLRDQ